MIENIQIKRICPQGNHARIAFDVDGVPYNEADYDYATFFSEPFEDNFVLSNLQFLLNQYQHASWADLKVALE